MPQTQTFADRYQSVLVPVIFEPWARELLRRAQPEPGLDILDLGCGTGVVTRELARQVPGLGSLTAVDHSPDMLAVARVLSRNLVPVADWVQADAAALPFDDARFDLAFCQQALQFFPDRPAALRELRRVLKPGARVVACVQRGLGDNPMLRAQAAALDATAGASAGDAVRAICSLPGADDLKDIFEDAGFSEVAVAPVTLSLHHPDARAFAAGAMGGMHSGDKLSALDAERARRAVELFLEGLGDSFDGSGMSFPHASHVITARA